MSIQGLSRALVLVRPKEGLADPYLDEPDRPSSPRPASVYRGRPGWFLALSLGEHA